MRIRLVFASLAATLCLVAWPHGGGLDANGGHYNRKTGEYHYHRQPAPKTPATPAPSYGESYWLNTSTGTRHNSRCRYFNNTKSGRACRSTEGTACGVCGG